MSSRLTTADLIFLEVAPPGREPQVRKLKGKVDNPYAVAWASYNAGKAGRKKKAKKEANSSGGLPQTLRGQKQAKTMCGATDWGSSAKDTEAELTTKKRNKLSKKTFAIPEERKFPIHDKSHARNALARASGTKYEKRVKAAVHKKYPGIGKESESLILKSLLKESVASKSYRFSESNLMEVVAPVMPAAEAAPEGPIVKCVLITEGLGNRADMHYYGPECIKNGVPLFEGQPCFVDHQKRSEQQDQPERTVRDKCGYFKNVRAETVDGRLGIVGELHYDLSETGRYAYDKACTAIHYKTEFPGSSKEYVGLSIAADGKLEERVMQVGDEVLDVKYVTEFTAVGSVDEVTSPARGGRFVQVLSR